MSDLLAHTVHAASLLVWQLQTEMRMPLAARRNEPSPDDLLHLLGECLEICRDGEKGYRTAAWEVHEPELKRFFAARVGERCGFVLELHALGRQLGVRIPVRGTLEGVANRGMTLVRLVFGDPNDRALLGGCLRGERAALRRYQDAIERAVASDLAPALISLLCRQRAAIERAYLELQERARDH